jgi:glucosamine 6-phosphate synthetase-like amidotransferase/phosphosugar isomerase protein
MTRHIYRNDNSEKELKEIIMDINTLRKHEYNHFKLSALVEMEHASKCLQRALDETQLSPKHIEEISSDNIKKDKLNLVIECGSRYMPCALNSFVINEIHADIDDFGDIEQDTQREPYTCNNRRFVPKLSSQEILDKYNINLDDYAVICYWLVNALRVSHCGMCV